MTSSNSNCIFRLLVCIKLIWNERDPEFLYHYKRYTLNKSEKAGAPASLKTCTDQECRLNLNQIASQNHATRSMFNLCCYVYLCGSPAKYNIWCRNNHLTDRFMISRINSGQWRFISFSKRLVFKS